MAKFYGMEIVVVNVIGGEGEGDVGVQNLGSIQKLMLAKVYVQRSMVTLMALSLPDVALMGKVWGVAKL